MLRSIATAALLGAAVLAQGPETVTVVDHPPTGDHRNRHYPTNRAPLPATPMTPLPAGAVRPEGWLLEQLRLQADGFHGHLLELSSFLKKDGNAWLAPDGAGTHGWEEPVYWLKGYAACAYALGDDAMLAETRFWIEAILRSQKPDGWFGPDGDRGGAATRLVGRDDLWPNMIALFCLQDWYKYTGDERVLALMDRYFDYLLAIPDDRFLLGYWPKMRGGDLLFSVLWRHQRNGADKLIDLAHKVHRRTAPWRDGVANWHNVNMGQGFGEPGTYWLVSGDAGDRRAAYANYDEMRRAYGQVPGGMFGGDENCRPGYTGPREAVETCGMVEMMLSLETLGWITGDPLWADRCEDVAFNSLPAATTADLRALRYLTAPNMVVSDSRSKSPGIQNGGPMYLMNPHRHRCCQHDFGHGWPSYAKHAWMATSDDGLAALLFTDSRLAATVGDGATVRIDEDTRYPFDEQASWTVGVDAPVRFPLYLRVPGWCTSARLWIAGAASDVVPEPGRYLRIERAWCDGDTVRLALPMAVSLRRWTDNRGTISVDRGPLTYSLEIAEDYRKVGGTDAWPALEIWPDSAWNYGLALPDDGDPAAAFEVVHGPWPADDRPFTHGGSPIRLRAAARRIPEWQLDHNNLVAEVGPSPVRSTEPLETVTLLPMGAARLRITAFPVIGQGDDAHTWEAPPQPLYATSASHTFSGDATIALADGLEPKSSGDHSIPRHTFWDRKGTTEWLQATFPEPRAVSSVAIYWFDDGPGGGCRVPASWRLFYRDGVEWVPVANPSDRGVAADQFNEVTFDAVMTTALRAEVRLQDGYSTGALEWRIGDRP